MNKQRTPCHRPNGAVLLHISIIIHQLARARLQTRDDNFDVNIFQYLQFFVNAPSCFDAGISVDRSCRRPHCLIHVE